MADSGIGDGVGERDVVGYGRNPPQADWPGGARLAVNFVINYEEGSEYAYAHGDDHDEVTLTEVAEPIVPEGTPDLAARSMFEYGSRVGFWRLWRQFERRAMAVTVFGCAQALERNPEAAAAIAESGHDVCSHGWRQWSDPDIWCPYDLVSRFPGRKGRAGDAGTSPSVPDALGERETRPEGRPPRPPGVVARRL